MLLGDIGPFLLPLWLDMLDLMINYNEILCNLVAYITTRKEGCLKRKDPLKTPKESVNNIN